MSRTIAPVTGAQDPRAPGHWRSQMDQVQPLVASKSRGRVMSGGGKRGEFVLVWPTPGRQWTSVTEAVSKVLKILPGLYEENVG